MPEPKPYELLARFNEDGTVRGVSVTEISGNIPGDPFPLADASDPAFTQFADAFSAAVMAERDALQAERDEAVAIKGDLENQIASLQARIDELTAVPDILVVSPRQAKLALYAAGLLDTIEAAVATAPKEVQIYYADSVEWRRDDPVLMQMAQSVGITDQQIDQLFATAITL